MKFFSDKRLEFIIGDVRDYNSIVDAFNNIDYKISLPAD